MTLNAQNMNGTAMIDAGDEQMVMYLEDLLMRQVDRLRRYDLDGAMELASESEQISKKVTQRRILEIPTMAPNRQRIRSLYQELCLIIAAERKEVADKLGQIRHGLKTLNVYGKS